VGVGSGVVRVGIPTPAAEVIRTKVRDKMPAGRSAGAGTNASANVVAAAAAATAAAADAAIVTPARRLSFDDNDAGATAGVDPLGGALKTSSAAHARSGRGGEGAVGGGDERQRRGKGGGEGGGEGGGRRGSVLQAARAARASPADAPRTSQRLDSRPSTQDEDDDDDGNGRGACGGDDEEEERNAGARGRTMCDDEEDGEGNDRERVDDKLLPSRHANITQQRKPSAKTVPFESQSGDNATPKSDNVSLNP